MAYEYRSITSGVFSFTIPDPDEEKRKTVKLFKGDTVIVNKQLTGTYLRMLELVREIEEESEKKVVPKKTTTKQKAKVEDKITAVTETEDIKTEKETVEVKTGDTVTTVKERSSKPAPKRRGRKKKED